MNVNELLKQVADPNVRAALAAALAAESGGRMVIDPNARPPIVAMDDGSVDEKGRPVIRCAAAWKPSPQHMGDKNDPGAGTWRLAMGAATARWATDAESGACVYTGPKPLMVAALGMLQAAGWELIVAASWADLRAKVRQAEAAAPRVADPKGGSSKRGNRKPLPTLPVADAVASLASLVTRPTPPQG